MELVFNSVWALVTLASVCLWLRFGRRTGAHRHLSLIALVMLVAILFPVISVSDDLWSIQNPAETDTLQRRDHRDSSPHTLPLLAVLPQLAGFELRFEFRQLEAPRFFAVAAIDNPALDPIDNRPPPIA